MSSRDPAFDAYVLKIREVLDRLDYYRLLGVERAARIGDVKKAFHGVAARFHPDRNRDADALVQEAIYDIYKRLNEAYRVLCDPERRALYDEGLSAGRARLDPSIRKSTIAKTPEDTIRSKEGRQFYRQAQDALKAGSLMQADLHCKVARAREPGNAAIETLWTQIAAAKAAAKKKG